MLSTRFILEIINILPQITLGLFAVLTIVAVFKKKWLYFYIGIILIAICIQILIVINTLFTDGLGIKANPQTYSELSNKKLWVTVVSSLYSYAIYGCIGLIVSGLRLFLKLKTRKLFLISSTLVLLGLSVYLLNKNLPCNYSLTNPCVIDNVPFVPSL